MGPALKAGPALLLRRTGRPGLPLPRLMAAVGLRGAGAGLTFMQNLLLARLMGAGGLGIYFISHSWTRVVGTATTLGLPPYVLRRYAALRHQDRTAAAEQLVQRSRRLCTRISLVAAAVTLLVSTALYTTGRVGWVAFAITSSVVVGATAFASTRLLADVLKARGDPELALTIEFALPNLFICLALLVVLGMGLELSVGWMLALVAGAVMAVPLAGWRWWDRRGPLTSRPNRNGGDATVARAESGRTNGGGRVTGQSMTRLAPRSLALLTVLGGLNMLLWAQPMLIMPFLVDNADIGRFGVAQRVVAVASLNIVALGSHFSPRFATAHAMGDRDRLQREVQRAATLSLVSYLPFFALFVAWPGVVLDLFGTGFDQGSDLLVIMAFGQLVNAGTGLCSEGLIMTGHERWEVGSTVLGVLVMVASTVLAGAAFGATGIAVAFAAALALRNTISFWLMRRVIKEDRDVQW